MTVRELVHVTVDSCQPVSILEVSKDGEKRREWKFPKTSLLFANLPQEVWDADVKRVVLYPNEVGIIAETDVSPCYLAEDILYAADDPDTLCRLPRKLLIPDYFVENRCDLNDYIENSTGVRSLSFRLVRE